MSKNNKSGGATLFGWYAVTCLGLPDEIRTCPHRVNVLIFRHNFVGGKAKIRRRAVALQGFLTKSPAKFDEKTCMNPYVDRF